MPTVEGHSVGRFLTWWPERRPASGGDASKPTSHREIRRFFNGMEGGSWPHSADAAAATFASAECRKRAGSRFHRSSSSLSCPASSGTARCSAARSESSPSTSEPGKTVLDRGIPARAGSAVHSEQRPGTEREQSRGWQAVGGCGTPYPGGLSGSTLSVGHQRSPGAPFKLESHACQHRTRAAHEQWGHGERGAKGVHHEPAGR